MPGQEHLKKEIIDADLCSSCGMCLGLCPYIKPAGDTVRVIHPCGLGEGTCYAVCPKTGMDVRKMDIAVFGREREDHALGVMDGIYFARALEDKAPRAQYGGVVTALAALALKEGIITGVALTGGDVKNPRPQLATSVDQVKRCAGSKYTAVPTLEVLNRAFREGKTGLGLVGRPCQVAALRRSQSGGLPGNQFDGGAVAISLGLFCFWSLSTDFYGFLAGKARGDNVLKMDIPVEGPVLETGSGVYRWPLDDIRPFIKKSCSLCFDCTSEWADLSVGSTEYDPGWNTLIVRTASGRDLVDTARAKGVIETAPYPPERLPLLRKAALNKKMRLLALPEVEAGGPGCPVVTGEYRRQIEAQWGGIGQ